MQLLTCYSSSVACTKIGCYPEKPVQLGEAMYRWKDTTQPEFEEFHLRFGGQLRSNNGWVRMTKMIPWERIEEMYAEPFSSIGSPAVNARIELRPFVNTAMREIQVSRSRPFFLLLLLFFFLCGHC